MMMMMMRVQWRAMIRSIVVVILAAALLCNVDAAIDVTRVRAFASRNNVTAIYVFGDSSVDPGNNNKLVTTQRVNFLPYGKDFLNGRPTGRFSNGRLATDLIAEAVGYTSLIPAYLDPHLTKESLLHGVSFASGGSGFDNLTAKISNVISLSKQLEYFEEYKVRLGNLVGKRKAEDIITNGVFVLSMGTNDFLQNYYVEPQRAQQYTIEEYQNYLLSSMVAYIKTMHSLGVRRLAVVGMEPFGCVPLIKAIKGVTNCDDTYNKVALAFNVKIKSLMATLEPSMGIKNTYIDVYQIVQSVIQNPAKYGFTETSKGCCGTGIEFGPSCKGLETCPDRTKYVYWDAVHFTEQMYKIIADAALESLLATLQ